jgi:hypothetical protein
MADLMLGLEKLVVEGTLTMAQSVIEEEENEATEQCAA